MNHAPANSLASKDPGGTDLKYRLLRAAWDLEAHSLTLYHVAEIPIYVRRNSLDRQGSLGVLRTCPVESSSDLVPTMVTGPAGDAKERDVGRARPEGLEGFGTTSKQFAFRPGDRVEKSVERCTLLGSSLRNAQCQRRKRGNATNHKDDSGPAVCRLHFCLPFTPKHRSNAPELRCGGSCEVLNHLRRRAWLPNGWRLSGGRSARRRSARALGYRYSTGAQMEFHHPWARPSASSACQAAAPGRTYRRNAPYRLRGTVRTSRVSACERL